MAGRLKPIATSKLLIVGTVRNCAKSLKSEIDRIANSFAGFAETKWLIVESDSSDASVEILEQLKSQGKIDYISLGSLQDRFPLRTERLAFCRNAYLDALNSDKRYADIDFVAVVDLDGMHGLLTREAVESCWRLEVKWDACFANQAAPYYDIWALRHKLWSPADCWNQHSFLVSKGVSPEKAMQVASLSKMLTIPSDAAPIRVQSAFGGLGIYKRALFDKCAYVGADRRGRQVCEHVPLHEAMGDAGARLFINPKLINSGYNEHSRHTLFHYRFLRMYRRFRRRFS